MIHSVSVGGRAASPRTCCRYRRARHRGAGGVGCGRRDRACRRAQCLCGRAGRAGGRSSRLGRGGHRHCLRCLAGTSWWRRAGCAGGALRRRGVRYFTNWSVLEPRSYYQFHRWGFGQVAELVEEGELGAVGDEYYGQRLPRYLADLSTNGRAATVARQDGKPVVFLAQFMGIPDDAVGYVYFDGEPDTDLLIDLFGYPFYLADGEPLGDGWWYVPDASLRWL